MRVIARFSPAVLIVGGDRCSRCGENAAYAVASDDLGIRKGDHLIAVDKADVHRLSDLVRQQYRAGVYSKTVYTVVREAIPFDAQLVLDPADASCGRKVHRFMLDHEDCTGGQPAVIDLVKP